MKTVPLAGLIGLAAAAAHAQQATRFEEPVLVTATRAVAASLDSTLRDAVVITRADIEAAGPVTLAELLQRRAGAEFRANGGPGQPTSLFLRGAGSAQTLVLVDGLRVGSASTGATALEAIPLEMVERIEVVKGPMSGLYGSDAIGGVVQVFTRGRTVPHLFAAAAYGSQDDRRVSAGLATADDKSAFSLAAGWRKVEARSASNERAFGHDPDRDPHENAFAVVRASHKRWTGELISAEAFWSDSRTSYDAGDPRDRNLQSIAGARVTSSIRVVPGWDMKLNVGHTRDKQRAEGGFPSLFETRQDQAAWIHEFKVPAGMALAGVEGLRQRVLPANDAAGAPRFAQDRRDTSSVFASLNESWQGQRLEANARRDRDEQYGQRNTGSVSWGTALTATIDASFTYGRGFRAPSFNDLYLVQFQPFFRPNPALLPERSRSREATLKARGPAAWTWRLTAFDNRIEDLVTIVGDTVDNLDRARIRGLELSAEGQWLGVRLRGQYTAQRPRDEATGAQLRLRARQHGSVEASRDFGPFTAGVSVVASGARYDANDESAAARLGGYARVDARVRYAAKKFWSVELAAVNLTDRRYETALGYDAPRRGVLLSARFDAF